MLDNSPFFESPEDALKACVQALGGTKAVGSELWRDKSADEASRLLSNCLNDLRPEKLELGQALWILSQAKEAGCYAPFQWLAKKAGYEATPISKQDEIDRLALVVEQATSTLTSAIKQLESIRTRQRVRSVA